MSCSTAPHRWSALLAASALLIALALLIARPGAAQQRVELPALAAIVAVADPQHVVINRGPAHGLQPTQALEIYPLRLDASKAGSYDDQNVLAWAVPEAGPSPQGAPDRHQLRLRVVGAAVPLAVGDVVGWRWRVPAEVAGEPLTRLLALGLQLLDAETRAPLTDLLALHSQPTVAEIRRQIGVLTQASRRGAALARAHFATARVKGGRHAGLSLAEALERTSDADVQQFLGYALAYRESYGGRTDLWLNFYATWLMYGSPDGADELRRQQHQRLVDEAQHAGRRGEFDRIRQLAAQMRALDPDSPQAAPLQRKLARHSNLLSRLQEDPDDLDLHGELASLLGDLGDLRGAEAQWALLLQRNGRDQRAASRRAQLLEGLGQWAEAAAAYQQLRQLQGAAGPSAAERGALAVQRALDLPSDATAALQAGLYLQRRQGDRPVALLLELLRRVRQSSPQPDQLRQAWNAEQAEVGRMGQAATLRAAVAAVGDHNHPRVRELLAKLRALHRDQPAEMAGVFAQLADAAMSIGAQSLGDELLQAWTTFDPQSSDAWYLYAILRMIQRRPDEALQWADKGYAVDPRQPINFWLRLRLLCTLGRTDAARAAAERLLQLDGRSTAALMSSARAALAQGRYLDAQQRVGKAWSRAFTTPDGQGAELSERGAVEMAAEQAAILQRKPQDRGARLRLLRALLTLDLLPQAEAQWRQLPAGSVEWRDGAAALGANTAAPHGQVVAWLRAGQDGSLGRQQRLQLAEAEAAAERAPTDAATLLRLARARVVDGQFHAALDAVALAQDQPAAAPALQAELAAVQSLARRGNVARADLQRARSAQDDDDSAEAELAAAAALQGFLQVGALQDAVSAAQHLAAARSYQGKDLAAIEAANQMMGLAKQLGDAHDIAVQGEVLAQILVRAGDLAAWAPALGQVQRQCELQGLLQCLADTRLHRARLLQREGRAVQALQEASAARATAERARPFLPAGSQLWFEGDATAQRFFSLAPQFDVLHIATHGVLRPDPADSHLRMADGPLTLAAISGAAGLDRRPRLVVLSACSTALEQGKAPGDEIASLANAFAIAGVPSLLATLWDVDDQATAELIAAFYRGLAQPATRDTLEALRQAQLHVLALGRAGRRAWQSPAAWAALQLVGDPR